MKNTDFQFRLYRWYAINQRFLPWRETDNPYYIWLSEVIMQQTKIVQGLPYYNNFIQRYPTIIDLASATEQDVLTIWQGLGYYSRARNLHQAAKYVVEKHNGIFPVRYEDICKLKGVGEYTAAAVASFAYGLPHVAIDGNMYRVLSRIYGISEPIDTSFGKKAFSKLANELLDHNDPAKFNNAMMDFGAIQCTPKQADCINCPFGDVCVAYALQRVDKLPVKKNKVKVRNRFFYYLDIRQQDFVYLQKRESGDIWQGLYDLLLIESNEKLGFQEIQKEIEHFLFKHLKVCKDFVLKGQYETVHVLTHQKIDVTIIKVDVSESAILDNAEKINIDDALCLPMSTLLKKYLLSN